MTQNRKSHGRERRKTTALQRQKERAKRSSYEQIQHLDKLLGKNQGAQKERARLWLKIEEEKVPLKELNLSTRDFKSLLKEARKFLEGRR